MSDDVSTIPNPGFRGSRAGRYGMGPQPKSNRLDPEMKKMMIIAGGLGVVLAGFFGISALRGHHSDGVPVIAADTRPIRVKPENPGGMKIDGADNDLFSGGSDTANARLAPAAETPDTKALQADESVAPPPAGAAPAEGPPPLATPLAALPQHPGSVPAPKPVPQQPAAPVAQSKPLVLAGLASPAVKPPPAPLPRAAAAAQPAVKPAAPAAPQPAVKSSGKAAVQLAAMGSEEAAHAEWQQLTKKMPDLLNGRQPAFSRIERDGKTFWRVRVAGFNDAAQGRSFCEQVRAKGGGCSVAEF